MNGRGWRIAVGLLLLASALRCRGAGTAGGDTGVGGFDGASQDVTHGEADVAQVPDGVGEVAGGEVADTDADAATDAPTQEAEGPRCTHQGFQVVSAAASTCPAAEGGFLELAAADSATAPANVFGLELLLDERALGPFVFVDENYATCERCIRIEAGCSNQGGCEKTFLVYAGHMDLTAWEDPGGQFRATFTGLRAREVTIAPNLPLTSTPVEGGETWCIDALTLEVAPLGLF